MGVSFGKGFHCPKLMLVKLEGGNVVIPIEKEKFFI